MQLLEKLILENSNLFWFVPEDKKPFLSEDAVVETILNYGDIESVKNLFKTIGKKKVSEIFYRQTHGKESGKNNYHELTANFFDLYFKRHVPGYTH